jgi:hypothetical protein
MVHKFVGVGNRRHNGEGSMGAITNPKRRLPPLNLAWALLHAGQFVGMAGEDVCARPASTAEEPGGSDGAALPR